MDTKEEEDMGEVEGEVEGSILATPSISLVMNHGT